MYDLKSTDIYIHIYIKLTIFYSNINFIHTYIHTYIQLHIFIKEKKAMYSTVSPKASAGNTYIHTYIHTKHSSLPNEKTIKIKP